MLRSQIPLRMGTVWASSAPNPAYTRQVPDPSQQGITLGAASFTDGFPPANFTPQSAGGQPLFGQDLNGVLEQITAWLQWFQAGGPVYYDATFATAIGGYPQGAVVSATGTLGGFWLNLVDNNTVDPDNVGTNWAFFNVLNNNITTGHHVWRPTEETLDGYCRANGLTCGNGLSNATERANQDCINLFSWLWTNFNDVQCPMYTSLGVFTPRGASALSDFNNNCAMTLTDMRGQWGGGTDTMGNTSANRLSTATFVVGNSTTPGSRGNFVQPGGGSNSSAFQTGTWYVKL